MQGRNVTSLKVETKKENPNKKSNMKWIVGAAVVLALAGAFLWATRSKPLAFVADPNFKPSYTTDDIVPDKSIPGRLTMTIVVSDDLPQGELRRILIFAAQTLMNENEAKTATVWANRESDRDNAVYSAAMCNIVPADDSGKKMRADVAFNYRYFIASGDVHEVDRIEEATRKLIYKALYSSEHYESTVFSQNLESLVAKRGIDAPGIIDDAVKITGDIASKEDEKIIQEYELTEQDLKDIGTEGLAKHWDMY